MNQLVNQKTSAAPPNNALSSIESNRALAEVQGQMLMAKQFPRDITAAHTNIMTACKRKKLAETAIYSYPRGGAQIEGPSIKMAEMLAQYWGNLDYGIIELERNKKESIVMAYAWCLQTNVRPKKIFTVEHVRYTRNSGKKSLTDPRDIYEMIANMGARRLRACILSIIPGDIVDDALTECNKTLLGNNEEPLPDRIKKMVALFAKIGVTQEMLEKRLSHRMDATSIIEVVKLGKIYKSLKEEMSVVEDWFEIPKTDSPFADKNKASASPDQKEKANADKPEKAAASPKEEKAKEPAEGSEEKEADFDDPTNIKRLQSLIKSPAYKEFIEEVLRENGMTWPQLESIISLADDVAADKYASLIETKIK